MLDDSPKMNVVESISLHARFKGNRTALICGERRNEWTDFNALVNAIASTLIHEGLKKGLSLVFQLSSGKPRHRRRV